MSKILIVDDEPDVREMLRTAFAGAGDAVFEAEDSQAGAGVLREMRLDLLILDWLLPGRSGIGFLQELRRSPTTADLPVIMLSAKGEIEDRVLALDAGADDYVTKPFSIRELQSRARALLRRAAYVSAPAATAGKELCVDPERGQVRIGGQGIALTPTEYALLRLFLTHQDRVFTRSQLLEQVWGCGRDAAPRTVDVYVRRLRRSLADYGCDGCLQTVRTVGYRFSGQID